MNRHVTIPMRKRALEAKEAQCTKILRCSEHILFRELSEPGEAASRCPSECGGVGWGTSESID